MKCDRAQELISTRIDEEVIFEKEALDNHLEQCPDCRDEFEGMRRLDADLWQAYQPERAAAAVLVDKVKAELQNRRGLLKPTVLLVDDDLTVIMPLRVLLADEFDVLLAGSAAEAQALFGKRQIDIVLTDERMPKMTGVELLEWILANHPRTQRLLWTGHGPDAAVDAVNRGQVFRYLSKPPKKLELVRDSLRSAARIVHLEKDYDRVVRDLSALNVQLEERVRERTAALEKALRELEERTAMLEKFALTDALTLLPNRKFLDHFAERELHLCRRYPAPLALAIIDVDCFKEINTTFGHLGGDYVLRELARCLTTELRKIDVLGRWAGDEFMLIAPQTHRPGSLVLAERLRALVQNHPFNYEGERIPVTITVGLAVVEAGRPTDYEQVKSAAAAALKRAKADGRNYVELEAVAPPSTPDEGRPGASGVESA
jgi:diguanylate cyclase (GGDEF)-like protein